MSCNFSSYFSEFRLESYLMAKNVCDFISTHKNRIVNTLTGQHLQGCATKTHMEVVGNKPEQRFVRLMVSCWIKHHLFDKTEGKSQEEFSQFVEEMKRCGEYKDGVPSFRACSKFFWGLNPFNSAVFTDAKRERYKVIEPFLRSQFDYIKSLSNSVRSNGKSEVDEEESDGKRPEDSAVVSGSKPWVLYNPKRARQQPIEPMDVDTGSDMDMSLDHEIRLEDEFRASTAARPPPNVRSQRARERQRASEESAIRRSSHESLLQRTRQATRAEVRDFVDAAVPRILQSERLNAMVSQEVRHRRLVENLLKKLSTSIVNLTDAINSSQSTLAQRMDALSVQVKLMRRNATNNRRTSYSDKRAKEFDDNFF